MLSIIDSADWLLFITTFIRRNNLITKLYWSYLLAGFVGFIYIFFSNELIAIDHRLWIVGLTGGLLFSLLISPVLHELLQALCFKVYGASSIKFNWNWNLFRFNIQANDFVLSKRNYYLICIITFLIFSILPFILAFFTNGIWLFGLLSLSFFHALYAMKDLAVCSYLYKFANCYIYSSEENKTIFYKSLP